MLSEQIRGRQGQDLDYVQIIAGSDSDFGKMTDLFTALNKEKIAYWLSALSAHRTPEELSELTSCLPNIYIPEEIKVQESVNEVSGRVKVILATAGLSAHLAGVVASKTQIPVVALPGESSTSGTTDSTPSMINMPPGIPNGFVKNQEIASKMLGKLMNLKKEDCQLLYIPEGLINDNQEILNLLDLFGIKYTSDSSQTTIGIQTCDIYFLDGYKNKVDIPIIIPVGYKKIEDFFVDEFLGSLNYMNGLCMGYNLNSKVNLKNAIIYAAQIFGMFDIELVKKLEKYRIESGFGVVEKNNDLIVQQLRNLKG